MKTHCLKQTWLSRGQGSPGSRTRGWEAAVVAVGLSCFVGWTCMEQVLLTLDAIAFAPEESSRRMAVRAWEASRATLSALVPILLVFLFAAWGAARHTGRGLRIARTAVLSALGVWIASLIALKYLVPSLIFA